MLVHEAVADDFVERLLAKTKAWTYGDPMDPAMDMGTVIDEAAAKSFEAKVDDAVARGARLLCGNVRRGALYSPTLVDRVTPDMPVVKYETFGPVSPVIRFRDIDEAIAIANGTDYGLSSSVCTNRLDYITRLVSRARRRHRQRPRSARAIGSSSRPSAASRIPGSATRKACRKR